MEATLQLKLMDEQERDSQRDWKGGEQGRACKQWEWEMQRPCEEQENAACMVRRSGRSE